MSEAERERVLRKFGVHGSDFIASGADAEVYSLSTEHVLKLYRGDSCLPFFLELQQFYSSLHGKGSPVLTPTITLVEPFSGCVAVVEERLIGIPLSQVNQSGGDDQRCKLYFDAVTSVATLQSSFNDDRFALFHDLSLSCRERYSWFEFLAAELTRKASCLGQRSSELGRLLQPQVECLIELLLSCGSRTVRLIHGDLFPENILISQQSCPVVEAIIDFGLLSMWGDPVYDLAVSWATYRMYTADDRKARSELLPFVWSHCEPCDRSLFFAYALSYALLTCDYWVVGGEALERNGHFQWALELISTSEYWNCIK